MVDVLAQIMNEIDSVPQKVFQLLLVQFKDENIVRLSKSC